MLSKLLIACISIPTDITGTRKRTDHLLQHCNSVKVKNVLHPQIHPNCSHPIPQEVVQTKKLVIIRLVQQIQKIVNRLLQDWHWPYQPCLPLCCPSILQESKQIIHNTTAATMKSYYSFFFFFLGKDGVAWQQNRLL